MIKNLLILAIVSIAPSFSHAVLMEVNVDKVYLPPKGFDDNDNIEITLDGKLPNLCYEVAETKFKKSGNTIEVIQYANLREVQNCKDGGKLLPDYMNWPINYTTTLAIGQLKIGQYNVKFTNAQNKSEKRSFEVEAAGNSQSIDNNLYAPVTSAFIPEIIYESNNVEIVLTGIIERNCLDLEEENIEVVQFSDVIVVLPKMNIKETVQCAATTQPIQKIVSLGGLKEGRYLIHIRSMNGKSVNRMVTVVKHQADPVPGFNP